jgi:UDPglucose 6-dehydrogenase
MASLGHKVLGIDNDEDRIKLLSAGQMPFYEDGAEKLLKEHLQSQSLVFSDSYDSISEQDNYIFLCVSTPKLPDGGANLSNLNSALDQVKRTASPGALVIIKSTVPIGTSKLKQEELSQHGLLVAANPEFLAEGSALKDFFSPSRIVVGAEDASTAGSLLELYSGISAPILTTTLTSAESIKHVANSLLALKLSFVNEVAHLCEATGADTRVVLNGVGLDPRIGTSFMNPGPGWGGSCFPKDASELVHTARKLGVTLATVEAAIESNQAVASRILRQITEQLGGSLKAKTIAVWGLAFKAGSDDVRESPAVKIIDLLLAAGAKVIAYDPMANIPELNSLTLADTPLGACEGSDALMVLTEWSEFSKVNPVTVSEVMKPGPVIFDTRRVLSRPDWVSVFSNFRTLGDQWSPH